MAVLGRISRRCISLIQVLENSCDLLGLGDEGNDLKFPAALTEERVRLENSLYQTCPSFPESGSSLGVWERLIGLGCGGGRSCDFEGLLIAEHPRSGGIGPEVMRSMPSRLEDLGEDTGEKLEDVEGFALRVTGEGVVMRSLSLIEEALSARGPVDSLQGDRTSQEVTADALDSGCIGGPNGGWGPHSCGARQMPRSSPPALFREAESSLAEAQALSAPTSSPPSRRPRLDDAGQRGGPSRERGANGGTQARRLLASSRPSFSRFQETRRTIEERDLFDALEAATALKPELVALEARFRVRSHRRPAGRRLRERNVGFPCSGPERAELMASGRALPPKSHDVHRLRARALFRLAPARLEPVEKPYKRFVNH